MESKSRERLIALARKLHLRREYEKIRYWVPNGGQEKFIEEIAKPGRFIIINGSGNGAGKTYSIIAILASCIWPKMAPPSLRKDVFSNWLHPKRARIISTPKECEEVGSIQTTIKELFPRGHYSAIRKGKHYPSQFISDTGWVVDIMTYEQDASEFAGPNIGLTIFNEPMPEDIWRESVARTRKGGIILVAMTSLLENPWVVDGLLGKENGKDIRVVYCPSEDNCKQHGKNGTLEHDQIERILAQYDPDEREARATGKPLSVSGRILKSFDRSVHVLPEVVVPPPDATIYQTVDPAIGKPVAAVYAWVDCMGVVTIFDEDPQIEFQGSKDLGLTVKEYADRWKTREAGRRIETRILDRHFGNQRRTIGGLTLKQEFSEAGIDFCDSYSMGEVVAELETGIMKIKEYLRYDKSKKIDALNQPRLRISPNCRNTIAAMERWQRDPKTLRPKEDYKDFADCVRYLVMSNPSVSTPKAGWDNRPTASYGV